MVLTLAYTNYRYTAAAGAYREMVRTSHFFWFLSSKTQWKT